MSVLILVFDHKLLSGLSYFPSQNVWNLFMDNFTRLILLAPELV